MAGREKGHRTVCGNSEATDHFIDATASVRITEDEILVRFQKRAHNPLLIAAGFHETDIRVPWFGGRRLRLIFG